MPGISVQARRQAGPAVDPDRLYQCSGSCYDARAQEILPARRDVERRSHDGT